MESTLELDSTVTQAFCSIPSCRSLLPLDLTAFHLPSTGMLVCCDCYKLYLKSEYEKVIAAERGAMNEKSVENNSTVVLDLEKDSMEVESPVELWNIPPAKTQVYPDPTVGLNLETNKNQSSTEFQCSEKCNYDYDTNSIPRYPYQEPNVLSNNDAYKFPSYQPEIYFNSSGVDFSENSAETITYTTLEPASSSPCPLDTLITGNPGMSCQEESLTHPERDNQKDAHSDKNSQTLEPQKENIREGQKCTNTTCKVKLYLWENFVHPVTKEKICTSCYHYHKKNGRDREVIVKRRRREKNETKNSETLEPQSETIQEGQKCANTFCKQILLLGKISVHPVTEKKICTTCYNYYKKEGKDREVIVTRRKREQHETNCTNAYCKQTLLPKRSYRHPVTQKMICQTCHKYYKRTGKDRGFTTFQLRKRKTHETNCPNRSCQEELASETNTDNRHQNTLQGDIDEEQVDGRQETERNTPCGTSSPECKSHAIPDVPSVCPIPNTKTSDGSDHVQPVDHNHGIQWNSSDIYPSQQLHDSQEHNCAHDRNPIPPNKYQEPTNTTNNHVDQNEPYHNGMHFNSSYDLSNTYQPQHDHVSAVDASENSAKTVSYTTLEPLSSISSSFVRRDSEHFGVNYDELNNDHFADLPKKDDKTLETQEPQSETIQKSPNKRGQKFFEGQKCANNVCKRTLLLGKIGVHPVTKEKICKACYNYYKRNGIDREVNITFRRREKHERHCANTFCKQALFPHNTKFHSITKEKICSACFDYYKRNGKEREWTTRKKKTRENDETNCTNPFCKKPLHSSNDHYTRKNLPHPVTKQRICKACYSYYKRNGRDREVISTYRRREKHETNCANTSCQQQLRTNHSRPHPVTREKICRACYEYFRRHGRDKNVVAAKAKKFKRDKYENRFDTMSISSDDFSIEELSESGCESDSSETDIE